MTNEPTARERINRVVREAMDDGEEYGQGRWPKWMDADVNADQPDYAGRIIAIVREALTSQEAKEEFSYCMSYDDVEVSVNRAMNKVFGTKFVSEGYDEPLGADDDGEEHE